MTNDKPSRTLFLEKLNELERARVSTVLTAPFAGIRAKHAWIAPKRKRLERLCGTIDPSGWEGWLRADPAAYPPRFGVAIGDAHDDQEVYVQLRKVEQRIGALAAGIERLGARDFVYYPKDDEGLPIPEESKNSYPYPKPRNALRSETRRPSGALQRKGVRS